MTRTRATVTVKGEEVKQEKTNTAKTATRVSTRIALLKINAVNVWEDIVPNLASGIPFSIIHHATSVKIMD